MPTLKWLKSEGNYYYFKDAPVHISSITLNKNSISLNSTGQTEQLTATVAPDDAVEKHVFWSSSDLTVATVTQTGLVTCVTPGNCTITASCDGVSATCSVGLNVYVDYLLVGGGGAGGGAPRTSQQTYGGGGGGGGDVKIGTLKVGLGDSYSISIGLGGARSTSVPGCPGGNTSFGSIIANGGCGGYGGTGSPASNGGASGSGCPGGTGNNTSPGGGGGAGGNGCDPTSSSHGGTGGPGICGYGGGGGGGKGGGGCDGGGNGAKSGSSVATDATNYGGGGGGGGSNYRDCYACGGAGYQGIVIIRYKTDGSCGFTCATGGCKYTCGDYTIHCFTSDGTFTVVS